MADTPPEDLADATLIAQILDATVAWEAATGRRAPQKVLREALWFYWQAPRSGPCLPGRGKYPLGWPWTVAARSAIAADRNAPLVVEHVVPVSLVVRHLLDRSPWPPDELAVELHRVFVMAVIAREEHGLLGPGDLDDPWSRYTAAGITDLAPLTLTPRSGTVSSRQARIRVEPKTPLSNLIRSAREEAMLSRPQLSRLCGLSVASIHSLEHERQPRVGEAEAILGVLSEQLGRTLVWPDDPDRECPLAS